MSTGIKFEVEQILDHGEKLIKIIKIQALSEEALPKKYFNKQHPYVRLSGNNQRLFYNAYAGIVPIKATVTCSIYVDNTYNIKEFDRIIEYCKLAGEHLRQVNKQLKKENAGWKGKKLTIII